MKFNKKNLGLMALAWIFASAGSLRQPMDRTRPHSSDAYGRKQLRASADYDTPLEERADDLPLRGLQDIHARRGGGFGNNCGRPAAERTVLIRH